MDAVNGTTVYLESRVSDNYEAKSADSQTVPLKILEVGTEIKKPEQSVQTDNSNTQTSSEVEVNVNQETVDHIIRFLKLNVKEDSILRKLNALHNTNRIAVFHQKQINLVQGEDLPILSVECNKRNVIAVSYGERHHDSWCSHNAKIIVLHGKYANHILLPSCPTFVRFGTWNILFIGTQSGTLYCAVNGQIIIQTEIHPLCITGLEWLSSQHLISSSLSGQLCVHLWDGISLQKRESLFLKVGDLPRKLRNSSYLEMTTGITSISCRNNSIMAGGETGSIWRIGYPNLSTRLIATEPDGVEEIHLFDLYFVVTTSFFQVKIYTLDGRLTDVLDNSSICLRCLQPDLLLFSDNNLLSVYSVKNQRIIKQQSFPNAAFTVNDLHQLISVSSDQKFVDIYQVILEA